jgi:hypothetical protein
MVNFEGWQGIPKIRKRKEGQGLGGLDLACYSPRGRRLGGCELGHLAGPGPAQQREVAAALGGPTWVMGWASCWVVSGLWGFIAQYTAVMGRGRQTSYRCSVNPLHQQRGYARERASAKLRRERSTRYGSRPVQGWVSRGELWP